MFKQFIYLAGTLAVSGVSHAALAPQQVSELIKQADQYRLEAEAAKVVSEVKLYQDGELDKTRLYHVYVRPDRESLVIFKSAVEAGQRMLMMGDNYWLQMPKSRRPIRITAMQKLLGEASVGDISTLTWSQDYQGEWQATEPVQIDQHSYQAHRLTLTASREGVSYQRVELWVDEQDGFPLQADLYLRSGKLAKRAHYQRSDDGDKRHVSQMILVDHIQPNKKTVINYQQIEPYQLSDKYYNPSYLSKMKTNQL